ncbi:MAG: cupin domain-containing protein [Burkholderiaceae bacterium]
MPARSLNKHPIHLGLGATAESEPLFTGEMNWFDGYGNRHAADGAEARLVTQHTFSSSWSMWEMHPNGAEVVLCTAGQLTLHQELPGGQLKTVVLDPGQYAINPPGVWHTADVTGEVAAVFITAGQGTQHRPRE